MNLPRENNPHVTGLELQELGFCGSLEATQLKPDATSSQKPTANGAEPGSRSTLHQQEGAQHHPELRARVLASYWACIGVKRWQFSL